MNSKMPDSVRRLLQSPPSGSKTRSALDFGVDLGSLARNVYALTPTERVERTQQGMRSIHELRVHLKPR